MRVKCLAQKHNPVLQPELEPGPLDPEISAPSSSRFYRGALLTTHLEKFSINFSSFKLANTSKSFSFTTILVFSQFIVSSLVFSVLLW